jgi:hypothetical protein
LILDEDFIREATSIGEEDEKEAKNRFSSLGGWRSVTLFIILVTRLCFL